MFVPNKSNMRTD